MDENNSTSKYETKLRLIKIILFTEYISLIGLMLGQMQSLKDFSFQLHEMMYLPINIAIFVLPVEIIVFICYRIKWRIQIREEQMKIQYLWLRRLITVFLVLLPLIYFLYMTNGTTTTGVYSNINKQRIENSFYLIIGDKKIRCTNNEYNLIDSKKEYLISFNWNKYFPTKGSLEYIELFDKSK